MKHAMIRSALVFALITLGIGLSACHDGRPDRDDRRHGEHHGDGGHDVDHQDHTHN